LIALFTNPVVKSLQKCQSKVTCMAVTNRLAFLYANVLVSTQIDGWVIKAVQRLRIAATSIPEYVSGWCPFATIFLTQLGLIKLMTFCLRFSFLFRQDRYIQSSEGKRLKSKHKHGVEKDTGGKENRPSSKQKETFSVAKEKKNRVQTGWVKKTENQTSSTLEYDSKNDTNGIHNDIVSGMANT